MPTLLTYREAAERLDVSTSTLRRLVSDGVFRTVDMTRPGSKRPAPRFREEDVQSYADDMIRRAAQS